MVFYQSDIAAAKLKIDTRDSHFLKVRPATLTSRSWYRLLQQKNENQIDEVIAFCLKCFFR